MKTRKMNINILLLLTLIIFTIGASISAQETIKIPEKKPAFKREVSNVQELLAACKEAPGEGGIITLSPGSYEISEPIIFKNISELTINGSGWNTKIIRKGEGDAIVFEGNCWNNNVKDLLIEGDKEAKTGSGIIFKNGEWSGISLIDNCQIRFFAQSGVRFEGNRKTPFSSNTVSRCWLIENREYQLYSFANNDFYFLQNQLGTGGKNPLAGCLMRYSSAGTYSMNYHWGNVIGLIIGAGSSYNRIENNRFEESREAGIIIGEQNSDQSVYFTIVSGNTIHTNSEHSYGKYNAVEAFDAHNITFTQNQVFSWWHPGQATKNGLVLDDNCTEWIIKDNQFFHHTEKGMIINKNGKHIIKDNIIGEKLPKEPAERQ